MSDKNGSQFVSDLKQLVSSDYSKARPTEQLDVGCSVVVPVPTGELPPRDRLLDNPAAHFLMGLRSPSSKRTQAAQLRRLARYLGACDWPGVEWAELGYRGCNALLARLSADNPSRATYSASRSALRGVMRQSFLLGQLDHETWLRIQELPPDSSPRVTQPSGRYLPKAEINAIFLSCSSDSPFDVRDSAVVATLLYAGLRRSEVSSLKVADVSLGEFIEVQSGKGRKYRKVPMIPALTGRLQMWISLLNNRDGSLFRRISRKGKVLECGISDQSVYNIVKKHACLMKCSPHDARRTFVSNLLDASHDLSAARRLAGHESSDTTVLYDRRDEKADQKAMQQLGEAVD